MFYLSLPAAFLAAGIGALTMGLSKGRWLPIWPTQEDLDRDMPPLTWGTLFHYLKNIAVECVRADPQWWCKHLMLFAIVGWIV